MAFWVLLLCLCLHLLFPKTIKDNMQNSSETNQLVGDIQNCVCLVQFSLIYSFLMF
jgi:hypothetical protein